MTRALGRKAPRAADARVVQLEPRRHLVPGLPAPPAALDLTHPWPPLYLGHNDEVGDCGAAGVANGISTEARREGRTPAFATRPTINDDIRALYFEYTDGRDEGVELLAFLHWLQLRDGGFFGERIGEPIAVDPRDFDQVRQAMALGLGLYVGAEMTRASLSSAPGSFWRLDDGDQAIAGGHCMFACGFITGGSFGQPNLAVESWGAKYFLTLDWWRAHVDEAYVLVDLERPSSCFNLEVLRADVQATRGGAAAAASSR